MMLNTTDTEYELVEQFLEVLKSLPEMRVKVEMETVLARSTGPDRINDVWVELQVAGKRITLMIEVKKILYPRDVHQILWKLKEFDRRLFVEPKAQEVVPFLIAESISPGAKELLREERVGYFDSGGSFFLSAYGVYFCIYKPPPKPVSKFMRSLFSRRRAQALHTLLMRHEEWFGVNMLAEQAKVSPATASQLLAELERFDWVVSRGKGPEKERHLREPTALLDAWVKQLDVVRPQAMYRYYVPSIQVSELIEKFARVLEAHGIDYEISHEAAGQYYAPYLSRLSQVRCRLLTSPNVNQAMVEMGARVVNEGINLIIIEANRLGELLFRERVNGIWLASPIQVYLDLVRSEGHSKEMAEHLRRERIGF